MLLQQQLAKAGITVNLQKVDPSQTWQTEVDGNYDIAVNYWTNDILDPDQKTTFVLGHDANMNYMTRYKNDKVKDLVAAARIEADPTKREAMYKEIQTHRQGRRPLDRSLLQPLHQWLSQEHHRLLPESAGRFFLEDTDKAQ